MNTVTEFLTKNRTVYLATIGIDGNPKVRPFQFMLEDGGKLYFCTANNKPVYQEMQKHPAVEFSICDEKFAWLRLHGKAVFSQDLRIKEKVLEGNPLVKSIYKTADNPAFEIFYLEGAGATIADFSGNPPQTFTF
ncbi:hypothetical protein Geob_1286 [Geotalea daltonii FRC-32]|uniref:Pyridoxamine 5'-phosphate oxidase N-terminal domain-containing protein n=1 Tax=Geotalea daltonii (strain DSM 22248 / JCM 15807 / FRC-32) TaxID=316067 RepID=B9M403_GEODF|nr:pyridoxamine 5'-phosphate oxidase family protein [Geotalea daltonii]ACM19646.1 hypothetical protein Geob_1286 [Geotalea daltonii FRC-32]